MYSRYYDCGHDSIYSSRVKDEENNVILQVPVPGFEKKDLNLTVKESYLVLDGKNDEYSIDRSYRLGDQIDIENINAEVVNGVLTVTLPKITPEKKEITIN